MQGRLLPAWGLVPSRVRAVLPEPATESQRAEPGMRLEPMPMRQTVTGWEQACLAQASALPSSSLGTRLPVLAWRRGGQAATGAPRERSAGTHSRAPQALRHALAGGDAHRLNRRRSRGTRPARRVRVDAASCRTSGPLPCSRSKQLSCPISHIGNLFRRTEIFACISLRGAQSANESCANVPLTRASGSAHDAC